MILDFDMKIDPFRVKLGHSIQISNQIKVTNCTVNTSNKNIADISSKNYQTKQS